MINVTINAIEQKQQTLTTKLRDQKKKEDLVYSKRVKKTANPISMDLYIISMFADDY